jgi:TonB family protein
MSERISSAGRKWRWFWALLFVFLAHAAAVFWFGERIKPIAAPEKPQPLLYIATDEAAAQKLAELACADPTLFALPSERGFSGGAWLILKPTEMSVSNWTAPPRALPLNVDALGTAITRYAETNRVSSEGLLDGLRGATPFELRAPSQPIRGFSSFAISGALSTRKLNWNGTLPPATNAELVTNTVVELSVNADGVVESVMLVGESGHKLADDLALRACRQFAFEPLPLRRAARENAVPQRGRATFHWHVVPPAITNGLAAMTP